LFDLSLIVSSSLRSAAMCAISFHEKESIRSASSHCQQADRSALKKKSERLLSISSHQIRSLVETKKNENSHRASPGRLGAEIVWGPAPPAIAWLARSARSLARPRRLSGLQRQIGPLLFRPNFELKKRGRACTCRTYN
jgi:hypothetical protein